VASPQIVALPALRLACRPVTASGEDGALLLAEAAALLTWARQHGRASAPWVVIDGERIEVAAPIPRDVELLDGLGERALPPGRFAALEIEGWQPSAIKAAASTLRAKPPEVQLAGADEPVFARLGEDGANVHLRIVEPA
jgi:hypothetical protein